MEIFVFSDFQGAKEIPDGNPDLVILLGDIYYQDAREIDAKYNCPKIGVYGNHDSLNEWKETSIKTIHKDTFEFEGMTFSGFGGCPKYNSKPNQFTEEECASFMSSLDSVDVFIAHSNPSYYIDQPKWDAHRGFDAFNDYIDNKQPTYFLHGHIHNPFVQILGNTEIHSVYPFKRLEI